MARDTAAGAAVPRREVHLLSGDQLLVDDVVDVATAAGVGVRVSGFLSPGVPRDTGTPLLVGEDVLTARAPLPGSGCVVVCRRAHGVEPEVSLWRAAVAWGAEHVVVLPDGGAWLAARLAEPPDAPSGSGHVIAVVPGHGGAGASVLAAALALAAATDGRRPLLVDGDPASGGLELLLGDALPDGLRWADLPSAAGGAEELSSRRLRAALPVVGGVALLAAGREARQPPGAAAVGAATGAGRQAFPLVVLDCPSWTSEAVALAGYADQVVVVTRCEVRAAVAARVVCGELSTLSVPQCLVVRGPGTTGLPASDVAGVLGLPLAAYLTSERAVARAVDRGCLARVSRRGSLGSVVAELLAPTLIAGAA